MVTEIQLFESPNLTSLDICLCSRMKGDVYEWKVDTRDELLVRILDAAARKNKSRDELRGTSDLPTRVAKWTDVDGGMWNIYCEL